jgi:hypothetical protein
MNTPWGSQIGFEIGDKIQYMGAIFEFKKVNPGDEMLFRSLRMELKIHPLKLFEYEKQGKIKRVKKT